MLTAESIVMLLINKVEETWSDQKAEMVKLESPIVRWKELIGHMDPEEAQEQDPLDFPKERPDTAMIIASKKAETES